MGITLYRAGESHAESLIAAGKVDEASDWAFSAEDGDKILGDPANFDAYASWHLGHDAGQDTKTKAAWSYPFGKDGKLYRSALRAIRTRAGQQNQTDISDAAGRLLDKLNEKATKNALDSAPARPTAQTRAWYRISAKADDPMSADVGLYDAIGSVYDGVSAKQFIDDLASLPESVKDITLHVNSPGGDVFDAIAIANALKQHPAKVTASIEGLAASAATIVTQGGADKVTIADNGLVMIHNPMALAIGTASDMRATADALDRSADAIIATYQRHSPLSHDDLAQMMEDTTWMSADEAVKNGFATEKVGGLKASALLPPTSVSALQCPPRFKAQLAAAVTPEAPLTTPEATAVLTAVERAGLTAAMARELIEAKLPMAEVESRIAAAVQARELAAARATDITAACQLAKCPELAAGYIASNMALDAIKTHLATVTAKLDKAEIDAHLDPNAGVKQTPKISVRDVYRERNSPPQRSH